MKKFAFRKTLAGLALFTSASGAMACGPDDYMGTVCMFAMNFCPQGTLPANGSLLQINQYQALYALLGTVYGGDGVTTFAVPDLRGRSAVGSSPVATPVTSPVNLGQKRGAEMTTLLASNLPSAPVSLSLTLQASTVNGTDSVPAAGDFLAVGNTGGRSPSQQPMYIPAADAGTKVNLAGVNGVGALAGGGQPAATLSPQLGLTACIIWQGIYPTRP